MFRIRFPFNPYVYECVTHLQIFDSKMFDQKISTKHILTQTYAKAAILLPIWTIEKNF